MPRSKTHYYKDENSFIFKLIDRGSTVLIKILTGIFGKTWQANYKTYMEM